MKAAPILFSAALLVALAASARAAGDHLECRKMKDGLAKATYVATVEGLTVETECAIKLPGKLLCVSAAKSGVTPPPPGGGGTGQPNSFVCYKLKCPKGGLPPLAVSDQFGTRSVTPTSAKIVCAPVAPPATTTTASTTTTTTTTTTLPTACCAPSRIVMTSDPGFLQLATLSPFPFPAGATLTIDAGPPAAFPDCAHPTIVPAGGFIVPAYCLPATGFTASIEAIGCESGGGEGTGTLWDGGAACSDADVSRVGDTSDPNGAACGTLAGGCMSSMSGSAGHDTKGNIDTTRSNGLCDGPGGLRTQLDIPILITLWNDGDDFECPDADGQYDPGTDPLVTQFTTILSPTTASSNAAYTDLNGDGCSFAGAGPDHTKHCSLDPTRSCSSDSNCTTPPPPNAGSCVDGPITGIPAPGPCCAVGQNVTLVATGIAFTGGGPLFDISFGSKLPMSVTSCGVFTPGSCTLTTDACAD